MSKEHVLSRRRLLGTAVGAGLAWKGTNTVFAEPMQTNRDAYWDSFQQSFLQVDVEELKKYAVDPEGNIRTRAIVAKKLDDITMLFQNDENFHTLNKAEIKDDLNMYFDMYWAGWEKYNIPWYLLWVVHIQESNVSRDTKADQNGDGAMQVIRGNLGMPGLMSAPDGYQSLELRPQRLSTRGGNRTTDSDEILRSAAYIRLFADERRTRNPKAYADDETAILDTVHYNYSAELFGSQRVAKYKELKKILEPAV